MTNQVTMSELKHVLDTIEYTDTETKAVTNAIVTIRRIKTMKHETLFEADDVLIGMRDELMLFKVWYINWQTTVESNIKGVKEAFTIKV